MVLVEGVPVADHHEHEDEEDGEGEDRDEGDVSAHAPRAVEAQHHGEQQHQHRHQHRQTALVQPEEVALVKSLQLLRLELFRPEHVQDARAAVRQRHPHHLGHLVLASRPRLLLELLELALTGVRSGRAQRGQLIRESPALVQAQVHRFGVAARPPQLVASGAWGQLVLDLLQLLPMVLPSHGPGPKADSTDDRGGRGPTWERVGSRDGVSGAALLVPIIVIPPARVVIRGRFAGG